MPTLEEISFSAYMDQLIIEMTFWYLAVFGSLGMILNALSIAVFSRKSLWNMTMGFYNVVLACVNNLAIFFSACYFLPLYYYRLNRLNDSFVECVLILFGQRLFTRMSSWIEVLIAVDRMVYTMFPWRLQFMNKKTYLFMIVAGLFVILIGATAQNFEYKLVATTKNATSTFKCIVDTKILVSIALTTIVTRIIIPLSVMLLANVFLIYNLKRARRERWMYREDAFARSVVALSILFLATHLPYSALLVYQTTHLSTNTNPYSYWSTVANFGYICALAVTSYNYIFTTLVNFVFNKLFRAEVYSMLRINST